MRRLALGLGGGILLLAVACQPKPTKAPIFGPWEEGLTLGYEDPTQPLPQRQNHRLQVRVTESRIAPDEPSLVRLTYTSLSGQFTQVVRHSKGGITLLGDDGTPMAQPLPEGFPASTSWTDRGASFQIMGRAAWAGAGMLPPDADSVGYWVECVPPHGPRSRTLYLPDLGEVEIREWRDGAWVTANQLVARGFTDLPSNKPAH